MCGEMRIFATFMTCGRLTVIPGQNIRRSSRSRQNSVPDRQSPILPLCEHLDGPRSGSTRHIWATRNTGPISWSFDNFAQDLPLRSFELCCLRAIPNSSHLFQRPGDVDAKVLSGCIGRRNFSPLHISPGPLTCPFGL